MTDGGDGGVEGPTPNRLSQSSRW